MKRITASLLLAFFLAAPSLASASLLVGATRVVYQHDDSEATVRVSNEGESPQLMQTWIDDGNPDAALETLQVPFAVSPAIERIQPGKNKWLRIRKVAGELPQDRESVYYLSVLGIPPSTESADDADGNRLQFAVRTRIKLFYRPEGLPGTADDAASQVRWELQEQQGRYVLRGINPTAFHISYTQVALQEGELIHTAGRAANGGGGMIAPFSSFVFPLGELDHLPVGALTVRSEWINDYGGRVEQATSLSP